MLLSVCFTGYLYTFGVQATEKVSEKAKEITKSVEEKVDFVNV